MNFKDSQTYDFDALTKETKNIYTTTIIIGKRATQIQGQQYLDRMAAYEKMNYSNKEEEEHPTDTPLEEEEPQKNPLWQATEEFALGKLTYTTPTTSKY